MNLDRQIDVKFYTLVGRREFSLPALRAALQQASQQILLIRVTGTLERPDVQSEPLPMLKETLDQIFPELADRPDRARMSPLKPLEALREGLPFLR
jgi:hypothetical protein